MAFLIFLDLATLLTATINFVSRDLRFEVPHAVGARHVGQVVQVRVLPGRNEERGAVGRRQALQAAAQAQASQVQTLHKLFYTGSLPPKIRQVWSQSGYCKIGLMDCSIRIPIQFGGLDRQSINIGLHNTQVTILVLSKGSLILECNKIP